MMIVSLSVSLRYTNWSPVPINPSYESAELNYLELLLTTQEPSYRILVLSCASSCDFLSGTLHDKQGFSADSK